MAAKKTIFIIPGFKHSPSQKAYKQLVKLLKKEGYFPIPVAIPWKNRTISENAEYFLRLYKQVRRKEKYIIGFSYGAMIAFIAASKTPTSGLILCSLSPYFKEDMTKKKLSGMSDLMEQRFKDFLHLPCSTLAKKVKTRQVIMLYGKKESAVLINRVTKAFKQINAKEKHLVPIQKTEHDISNKRYLHTIHFAAQQLMYL